MDGNRAAPDHLELHSVYLSVFSRRRKRAEDEARGGGRFTFDIKMDLVILLYSSLIPLQ